MRTAAALLALACLAPAPGVAAQTASGFSNALEDFEKRFPPVKKNAAAGELEALALLFGMDWRADDPKAEHPSREDLDAYRQAGFSSWLDSQVKTSDDWIAPPPSRLKALVESKRPVLARAVALLEKETPEWGFDLREPPRQHPELLLALSMNRVLLSAALVEEETGRHAEAGDFLEASWSLLRSISWQPHLTFQLVAIAAAKLQAGVLRKMSEPSFGWADRMSGDAPWQAMLSALESQGLVAAVSDAVPANRDPGSWRAIWTQGWRAVTDQIRGAPPCQVANRSLEELWTPMEEALSKWSDPGADPSRASHVFKNVAAPVLQPLRRCARLMLDRELTEKILQLRAEKAASRANVFPEKFFDLESRVCPGSAYEYRPRGAAMTIRFAGSIAPPDAPALALPLSFETRAPQPTPTPERAPAPLPSVTPRSVGDKSR